MKIYFSGSISAGRTDQETYFKIIKRLKEYGQVLTEHVGDKNLTDLGEKDISDEEIFERDISWLKEANVLVSEISTPSLGVGYEIARAEEWGKRIICLYRKLENGKRISGMIKGNRNIVLKEYSDLNEAFQHIDKFFK